MHPTLMQEVAGYRQADMLREAERARLAHQVSLEFDRPKRRFLRRRHKVAGPGYRQFPEAAVFGELGVVALDRLPRRAPANAARETRPRAG